MKFIAEFCQNHNGDFECLKDMVYAAKESGADYAKIQTIFADNLTYRERFEEGIQIDEKVKSMKRPYKLEYERLKGLELTLDEQHDFVQLCQKVGIKPLTTVFTRDTVHLIKNLGFQDIKIASYDCASQPMLLDVKHLFKKIIVSTGATFDEEIKDASNSLNGSDFSFLHCVTMYPTPLNEFNLARMEYLRKYSKETGWSDHSLIERDGILGTLAAIYFGANIIERHFTILPRDKTKDGPVSVDVAQIKEMKEFSALSREDKKQNLVEQFKDYNITWGQINRQLSEVELLNRDYFRGRFASKLPSGEFLFNWEEGDYR
jgi:N,N'-diacetyllegionaminate synthase